MIQLILSIFFIALVFIYSGWILLFLFPRRIKVKDINFPPISILIPAHNEERHIAATLYSVLSTPYPSSREVIVINDGSTDNTGKIVENISKEGYPVKLINVSHGGKSRAINTGAEAATHEVVVVLDADTYLHRDSLIKIVRPLSNPKIAAVSGVIRAKLTKNPLTWFQDFEYILGAGWRYVYNNIGSTYILPCFVAFKKSILLQVGGFSTDTLSEDVDIGIRLRKAGYDMTMSNAVIYTHVPKSLRALVKQRMRWGRGILQVVRKHKDVVLNPRYGAVGIYGIPTQIYWFLHALVVIPITLYQIIQGYYNYFAVYGTYWGWSVLRFLFGWLSAYGMLEYIYFTLIGIYELTNFFILVTIVFLLSFIYNFLCLFKFAEGIKLHHLLALFFFFPYSIMVLTMYTLPLLQDTLLGTGKYYRIAKWEKMY